MSPNGKYTFLSLSLMMYGSSDKKIAGGGRDADAQIFTEELKGSEMSI